MKTIRGKLVSLFAAEMTAAMLVVLLLFNVAIFIYFDRSARAELKNTFSTMDILIENQLTDALFNGGEDAVNAALSGLGAALTASHLAGDTAFYILDEDYSVLFPKDGAQPALSDRLRSFIRTLPLEEGTVTVRRFVAERRYVAAVPFDKLEGRSLTILFVAGTTGSRQLTQTLNVLLAAVMLVSVLLGFLFTNTAAKRISGPIRKACGYAAEIGNGHFIEVPPDRSSEEIFQLSGSINEMSARLKAADQAQKQFLQNASHELRTPLMSIQGYAEAIEQGVGIEPAEAAAVIHAESERMNALVGDLLTLSRMENNLCAVEPAPMELNAYLSEYVTRLEGAAFRVRKRIVFVPAPEDVMVSADERLLSQAVGNVVSNCLRYAKTEVEITLHVDSGEAVLTVGDDGPGIGEADMPHIFDRFYKGKGGSFGLGLAIARKAVQLLGGSLQAENGARGAVFTIRLAPDRGTGV